MTSAEVAIYTKLLSNNQNNEFFAGFCSIFIDAYLNHAHSSSDSINHTPNPNRVSLPSFPNQHFVLVYFP